MNSYEVIHNSGWLQLQQAQLNWFVCRQQNQLWPCWSSCREKAAAATSEGEISPKEALPSASALKNVWKNTLFYASLLKSVYILEFLSLLGVMFSFCGQEWSRSAENPAKPLFSVGVAVEHRNHDCLFTMVVPLVSLVHWFGNCITYIWKCIQEETFQAKQMTLIRYQYVTKKLPWKNTHLVWIKGVGFRTGDIIQLDKLVKYWQEAERQQCLCWGGEHASAFLIEHSQDFHTHNGWLQEPKRSSPVQCPAWFIIPPVV